MIDHQNRHRRPPCRRPRSGAARAALAPLARLLASAGLVALGAAPAAAHAATRAFTVDTLLEAVPVSGAQRITQQTPIAVRDGIVYFAQLEPGPDGDENGVGLHTVLYRGEAAEGNWSWTSVLIDTRSVYDPWHTPPAVGIDRDGRVHVAYNMHNFPWQYKVSTRPHDLSEFEFRGETIPIDQLRKAKFENRTDFVSPGEAAIPGNQITYPAFYNDPDGVLYVTYRFAAKPARRFDERTMSAGIARHDASTRRWTAIGGAVATAEGDRSLGFWRDLLASPEDPVAFAAEPGWTAYHPRLAFAPDGAMHVSWAWREGVAGDTVTRPCHLRSGDGGQSFTELSGTPQPLPARPSLCGNMGVPDEREHYTTGNTTINSRGEPHLVLSPLDQLRELRRHDGERWHGEPLPHSASEIFFDAEDNLWAIASGLNLFVRPAGRSEWLNVYTNPERVHCGARAAVDLDAARAYVHAPHCHSDHVSILAFDLTLPQADPTDPTESADPVASTKADLTDMH